MGFKPRKLLPARSLVGDFLDAEDLLRGLISGFEPDAIMPPLFYWRGVPVFSESISAAPIPSRDCCDAAAVPKRRPTVPAK